MNIRVSALIMAALVTGVLSQGPQSPPIMPTIEPLPSGSHEVPSPRPIDPSNPPGGSITIVNPSLPIPTTPPSGGPGPALPPSGSGSLPPFSDTVIIVSSGGPSGASQTRNPTGSAPSQGSPSPSQSGSGGNSAPRVAAINGLGVPMLIAAAAVIVVM